MRADVLFGSRAIDPTQQIQIVPEELTSWQAFQRRHELTIITAKLYASWIALIGWLAFVFWYYAP